MARGQQMWGKLEGPGSSFLAFMLRRREQRGKPELRGFGVTFPWVPGSSPWNPPCPPQGAPRGSLWPSPQPFSHVVVVCSGPAAAGFLRPVMWGSLSVTRSAPHGAALGTGEALPALHGLLASPHPGPAVAGPHSGRPGAHLQARALSVPSSRYCHRLCQELAPAPLLREGQEGIGPWSTVKGFKVDPGKCPGMLSVGRGEAWPGIHMLLPPCPYQRQGGAPSWQTLQRRLVQR